MRSIFERALGSAFDRLHPELQRRFGLTSADGLRCIGRGRMRRIDGNPLAWPVLMAGTLRNLLFPETGAHVPFQVRTTPFAEDGVEALAYIRRFEIGPGRRFDAYMHYDADRECIVDALGTHRELVTELGVAAEEGAVHITTGAQWIEVEDRSVPVPSPLRADVDVTERYDDAAERFAVSVDVRNPLVGRVFAYEGTFTVRYEDCDGLPATDAPVEFGVQ